MSGNLLLSDDEEQHNPPLAGRYWTTVALMLLALCPDLVLNSALVMLQPTIASSLHGSASILQPLQEGDQQSAAKAGPCIMDEQARP